MEEKKTNQGAGMPAFDVWAYDVLGESDLKAAASSGSVLTVKLMRRARKEGCDTLIYRVPVQLKVLDVKTRRRAGAAAPMTHRELEVKVEVANDVQKGVLNAFDDGQGLSAFKAGTQFTLVFWPDGTMARVSRSSEVLYT